MKVLFYPDGVKEKHRYNYSRYPYTMIGTYMKEAGYQKVTDPLKSFDRVIYWSFHRDVIPYDDIIKDLMINYNIINIGCNDIRKSRSEYWMEQVFGYNSLAGSDEEVFLEKSEKQGLHDIKFTDITKERKPGYIYVKCINNQVNENTVRDYRLVIFDGVKALQVREKPIADRFGRCRKERGAVCTWHYNINQHLSEQEIRNVNDYCRLYRTHIAELDVLRDADGRLYIVDNNNVAAISNDMREMYAKDNNKILKFCTEHFIKTLKNHD